MAFNMGVSKEKLEGMKPVPNGVYEVQFKGFEPQLTKDKTSINFRPHLVIVNHQLYNGQRIFDNLNIKAGWILQDFTHAFGYEMEMHQNPQGEEEAHFPGGPDAWQPDPQNPDDISKAKYTGPLMGQVAKIEVLYEHKAGQKPRNVIKQYFCAVKDCAVKNPEMTHSDNLVK